MNIEDLLREAGREARNEQISPVLEKNLICAYQARKRRHWMSMATIAASVVMAIAGLWQLSRLTQGKPETTAHTMVQEGEILPEVKEMVLESLPVQPESSTDSGRTNKGWRSSGSVSLQPGNRHPVVHQEIRTRFYALDASVLTEAMDGYLIRVQVPRAAMASFGIPVQYEVEETRVNADLLIGEDGMARAIRFVQPIQ